MKLSLIDYPGKIGCTVFTQGCAFRCRFCHNPELIPTKKFPKEVEETSEKEFFEFLESRRGKLDGVTITGGEPTIHPDLPDFIRKIKEMGFLVKLDTMGINPSMVKSLLEEKLIDCVAMDIKHSPEKYHLATGVKSNMKKIQETIELLKNSEIEYIFRTTCVPGIHSEEDFEELGEMVKGAKTYHIQEYRDEITYDKALPEESKNHSLDLEKIKQIMEPKVEKVEILKNL
jgi:pyruvate formate lyase activating enzyme